MVDVGSSGMITALLSKESNAELNESIAEMYFKNAPYSNVVTLLIVTASPLIVTMPPGR